MMPRLSKEQRREQLLAAALQAFSTHGFDGTSTRSIAESAGVTEALIFHYFPTKLALFHNVLMNYGVKSLEVNQPDPPPDAPLPDALRAHCHIILDAIGKNRSAFQLLIGAAITNQLANDDLNTVDERMVQSFDRLLTRYDTAGTIPPGRAGPTASIMAFAMRGFIAASIRLETAAWDALKEAFIENLIAAVMPGLQVEKPGQIE